MTEVYIYNSKYLKHNLNLLFLPCCAKPVPFDFNLASTELIVSHISNEALFSGQENCIPQRFMVTSKFRKTRFTVRGDSSQGVLKPPGNPARPQSTRLPSLPWVTRLLPLGLHLGPPAWRKPGQDVVWPGQPLSLRTHAGKPILFFTQTPRHRISSFCWFS